jgi:hypothetical protein
MVLDQAFELILEHYNGQSQNEKSKPYKLNERFTGNEFNYKRVYTREGDDWHWLTITNKGEGQFMATFTDEKGKITDWHFYSVKENELILSDKENVLKKMEGSHSNINSIKRLQKQNIR